MPIGPDVASPNDEDFGNEVGVLIDELNKMFKGRDSRAVTLALAAMLEGTVVSKAPSIEAACSVVRSLSRDMQEHIRASWDEQQQEMKSLRTSAAKENH
jgi:hypothetical protein